MPLESRRYSLPRLLKSQLTGDKVPAARQTLRLRPSAGRAKGAEMIPAQSTRDRSQGSIAPSFERPPVRQMSRRVINHELETILAVSESESQIQIFGVPLQIRAGDFVDSKL